MNDSPTIPMISGSCPAIKIDEDGIHCSILSKGKLRTSKGKLRLAKGKPRSMNYRSGPERDEDGNLGSVSSSFAYKEGAMNRPGVFKFDIDNIFDDQTLIILNSLTNVQKKEEFLLGQTDHFIQAVDSAVQQYCGPIDTFVVRYFLPQKYTRQIDAWIKVAVASETKKLVLFLGQVFSEKAPNFDYDYPYHLLRPISLETPSDLYDFPFHLLRPISLEMPSDLYDFPFHLLASSSVEQLCLSFCSLRPPLQFHGLHHLKILNLWGTYAAQHHINWLLSNCSSLEILSLLRCQGSIALTIPHSLSQLRRLIVKECTDLKRIAISNTNLEFFCYEGQPVYFDVTPSSRLCQARFYLKTAPTYSSFNDYVDELATIFSQLSVLALNISCVSMPCRVEGYPTVKFDHLKRLDWECPPWNVGVTFCLLHLTTLLDAAPFLTDLKLTFSMVKERQEPPQILGNLVKYLGRPPHPHLKTVKICEFYFERWQLQIVLLLLKIAPKLESMTLVKGKEEGRKYAKEINQTDIQKLSEEAPPNVRFTVL